MELSRDLQSECAFLSTTFVEYVLSGSFLVLRESIIYLLLLIYFQRFMLRGY